MKNKIVYAIIGAAFIVSSALLLSAECISAALGAATEGAWGKEEFTIALRYTPTVINMAIGVAFVVGIIFIALSVTWDSSDKK